MPRYVGPSHGPGGPTLILTLRDTEKQALLNVESISIRTPRDDYRLRFAEQTTESVQTDDGQITVCVLSRVRPDRHNMLESDMLCRLKCAVDGERGYYVLMDAVRASDRTPAPDTEILSLSVVRDKKELKIAAPDEPAPIRPLTPYYEQDIPRGTPTRNRIAKLLALASGIYENLPDAKDWTRDEFVAEYLIRHGVQADLNWAEKESIPVEKWHMHK